MNEAYFFIFCGAFSAIMGLWIFHPLSAPTYRPWYAGFCLILAAGSLGIYLLLGNSSYPDHPLSFHATNHNRIQAWAALAARPAAELEKNPQDLNALIALSQIAKHMEQPATQTRLLKQAIAVAKSQNDPRLPTLVADLKRMETW